MVASMDDQTQKTLRLNFRFFWGISLLFPYLLVLVFFWHFLIQVSCPFLCVVFLAGKFLAAISYKSSFV